VCEKKVDMESSRCCYPWLSGIPYNEENITSGGTVGETSGPVKLEEMRRFVLGDDLERMMAASDILFTTLYTILNEFCVPLIMDTLYTILNEFCVPLISDGYQGQGSSASPVQTCQDGEANFSFAKGDSDRPVCSDDIRSPEIIATVNLELNNLNFPDMCAKETHSCLLKSHFKNVTSSALDCLSLH
nr:hypothetical protein [Tanacetum cinerariifolium]